MSPDESRLLTDLLDRLARLPAGYKDPEADALIKAAMIKLPDAPYQLVQACILQEQAALGAKARIDQLEAEMQRLRQQLAAETQPRSTAPGPWGAAAAQPVLTHPGPWGGSVPAYRGSSFLGNVAETAVGIAGGMLLAQGVSNLFGGHGSVWGGNSWGAGPSIVENTTINETFISNADHTDAGNYDFDGGDNFNGSDDFYEA
jgi:hypothetical protein